MTAVEDWTSDCAWGGRGGHTHNGRQGQRPRLLPSLDIIESEVWDRLRHRAILRIIAHLPLHPDRLGSEQRKLSQSGKGEKEENKGVNLVRSSLKGNDCAIPAEIYRMRSLFILGPGVMKAGNACRVAGQA